MPDVPSTGTQPGNAEPGTAPNDPAKPATVSIEDFAKLQKTVDSLAGLIRRERQQEQRQTTNQPPPNQESDEPDKEERLSLKKLQEDIRKQKEDFENDKKAAIKEKRDAILLKAIASRDDVDPDASDLLFDRIEKLYGSKMTTEGGKVVITDELGDKVEISDAIETLMKSPQGKFFRVQKAPGPNARPGRAPSVSIPGQKSYLEMSREELLKLPLAEQRALAQQAYKGTK